MQPKKFVIRKSPSSAPAPAPSYYQPTLRPNQESHDTLCFWLGALFGPFGLLLAAIVGNAAGLVKAVCRKATFGVPGGRKSRSAESRQRGRPEYG